MSWQTSRGGGSGMRVVLLFTFKSCHLWGGEGLKGTLYSKFTRDDVIRLGFIIIISCTRILFHISIRLHWGKQVFFVGAICNRWPKALSLSPSPSSSRTWLTDSNCGGSACSPDRPTLPPAWRRFLTSVHLSEEEEEKKENRIRRWTFSNTEGPSVGGWGGQKERPGVARSLQQSQRMNSRKDTATDIYTVAALIIHREQSPDPAVIFNNEPTSATRKNGATVDPTV